MTSHLEKASPRNATARLLLRVTGLSRASKRTVSILADFAAMTVALWSALALKSDSVFPTGQYLGILMLLPGILAIPVFWRFGLYRAVVRYIGLGAMSSVLLAVAVVAMLLVAIDRLFFAGELSLTALIIFWGIATLFVVSMRVVFRILLQQVSGRFAERVAIYGAGAAGAQLCVAMLGGKECLPVAFVDDKRALHGTVIHGVEVYPPDTLSKLAQERDIVGVLLALPSASRRRKREILATLEPVGLHVRSLPDISEILAGRAGTDEVREVDVADLLGRDPVPPYPHLFGACVKGKAVMVTGAGGSIGSELCRQIISLQPSVLVLFENSELALYQIDLDLRAVIARGSLGIRLVPLLGNAHHKDRVFDVLSTYKIQTVYHAAAYKHVPIVEQNVIEGIYNNVLSTWNTAEAALEARVETFVLVSTDKAVNPTNVMGATKRLAEIVLQGMHQRSTRTRFCMVRFGNVLASSGSVVPRFYEQIRAGGPITVTHPDVVRYFMTIPEAAQLVIQAGSMASGGDVFVLDMGKPVKIDELARRLVKLMGMTVRDERNPDGDIEIAYTGLRPAEKLYEELLIGSNVSGTDHPMIMRAVEHALPWSDVENLLGRIVSALRAFDCSRSIDLLNEAVVEYRAAPEMHDLVSSEKKLLIAEQSKITDLNLRRGLRPTA